MSNGPSFDKFMDSFTQELIDTPDAEILEGKDPAAVLAEVREVLKRGGHDGRQDDAACEAVRLIAAAGVKESDR